MRSRIVIYNVSFSPFVSQVQSQVFSETTCASLINTIITHLINQYQNVESDFISRIEISKASSTLNGVREYPSVFPLPCPC